MFVHIKRLEISISCQMKLLENVLEISLEGILWLGNKYWFLLPYIYIYINKGKVKKQVCINFTVEKVHR